MVNYPGLPQIKLEIKTVSARSLRVRFKTRYLWIGLDVSHEHPDWIGLYWVSKTGPMSNSTYT